MGYEYAVLYELTVHAPRTLTHAVLLQRVWGPEKVGEPWLVRDMVRRLRGKLGDDADNPKYIFTEPRVGYRMRKGGVGGRGRRLKRGEGSYPSPLPGRLLVRRDGNQARPTRQARTESERFLILSSLVEIGGFEPPASALRTRRSPN